MQRGKLEGLAAVETEREFAVLRGEREKSEEEKNESEAGEVKEAIVGTEERALSAPSLL